MVRKFIKVALVGVWVVLPAYLFVVFLWANAVVDELLGQTRAHRQAVALQPRHIEALVRIEDPAFYAHHGLNISKGQGVTTITSVLARDLFLGQHDVDGVGGAMQSFYRGVFNCCRKLDLGRDVMALVLDAHTTKQQQLDMYLNRTYLGSLHGRGVIGFEAAAKAYHGKPLSRLTDREFYSLLAMALAPNHYHPVRNPEIHADRARRIEAVATGKCDPTGWLDLTYDDCIPARDGPLAAPQSIFDADERG
ncbi:biosynthetic peptidoglycan transglycosylase [Arenimonas sp. MALMAid1274]|uniref:biosynthetic peptidoglycan transglycosylase n=1 Tax=Arenimonas sp. MALMAid1274 TaxID=3411630 RepID=UPI003BA0DD28